MLVSCSYLFPDYESKKQNLLRAGALENTGKRGEETGSAVSIIGTCWEALRMRVSVLPGTAPHPEESYLGLGCGLRSLQTRDFSSGA